MLPLLVMPSAKAGPAANAALSADTAAKRANLAMLNVMVASLLIRLWLLLCMELRASNRKWPNSNLSGKLRTSSATVCLDRQLIERFCLVLRRLQRAQLPIKKAIVAKAFTSDQLGVHLTDAVLRLHGQSNAL
jgi:hypothetical protein